MLTRISLSLSILFFVSSLSFGQTLTLTEEGYVEVQGQLSYYRDSTKALTIADVRDKEFISLKSDESPNFGFDPAAHWFRLDIKNHAAYSNWFLELAYNPLDYIHMYMIKGDSIVLRKVGGDRDGILNRDNNHNQPLFSFNLDPEEQATIYVRVQTISAVQVPITIYSESAFRDKVNYTQMINGLYYGAMIMMILYQIFLFISLLDRITFYYVLTLIAMLNVLGFFHGYIYKYLYPGFPDFTDIHAMFTGPAFLVASTLLTRAFLKIRQVSKLLDNLLLINLFLDIAVVIFIAFNARTMSVQYHNYSICVYCVLAIVSAGYCLYRKFRPARFYLVAWFILLVATAIFTISSVGYLPGYLGTNYTGLMIGTILQAIFISFALADRWEDIRRENEAAKELELQREQLENERLEREVALRVDEIQKKSKRLEEVNQVKDKLFSVVSHDIKGPLSSLQLALSLMKTGGVSNEEFEKLSKALEVRFGETTEFIENLLQWATLQLRGETYEPLNVSVKDISEEAIRLLAGETNKKGIRVINHLKDDVFAYADVNMLRTVFRNLLTNAIKFTDGQGEITLNYEVTENEVVLSIADTGVGIPKENQHNLFTLDTVTTLGTKSEKGTGLGLLLCKEFIEKNGGDIWFESKEGVGTTFYFSLPTAQPVANEDEEIRQL
jgi:signal transduction histidine kinase